MNIYIHNLDNRLREITDADEKTIVHLRNIVINKLRAYKGDFYIVDVRLENSPRRLNYPYMNWLEVSSSGFNLIIDLVVD